LGIVSSRIKIKLRIKIRLIGGCRVWKIHKNRAENRPKRGSKKVFSGAPGRGVLRFLAGGYRNPVHFLAFFGVFSVFLQI